MLQRTLTFISSLLCASGSIPAAESSLIFCALDARSAMDSVIFLCVWLDVEWGLKVSFSLNTNWACKPVPCTKKEQKKIILFINTNHIPQGQTNTVLSRSWKFVAKPNSQLDSWFFYSSKNPVSGSSYWELSSYHQQTESIIRRCAVVTNGEVTWFLRLI